MDEDTLTQTTRGYPARRRRRGAVIVEFALVVPFISLIVFGVIDFSKAYTRMNALDSALREGGRYGSRWKDFRVAGFSDSVKTRVREYGDAFGFPALDTSRVTVTTTNNADGNVEFITITMTNHPIPLQIFGNFLGVQPLSISRTVNYRWECAGLSDAQCSLIP